MSENENAVVLSAEEILAAETPDDRPVIEPEPGTYAYTARMLVEIGVMDGDEADYWKDMMKEGDI